MASLSLLCGILRWQSSVRSRMGVSGWGRICPGQRMGRHGYDIRRDVLRDDQFFSSFVRWEDRLSEASIIVGPTKYFHD